MWLFSSRNAALTSPFPKQIGLQTLLHAWMAPYERRSRIALFSFNVLRFCDGLLKQNGIWLRGICSVPVYILSNGREIEKKKNLHRNAIR